MDPVSQKTAAPNAGEVAKRLGQAGYREIELITLALAQGWIKLAECFDPDKAAALLENWPAVLDWLAAERERTAK